eukprot:802064-Rhodomonas_salina.2
MPRPGHVCSILSSCSRLKNFNVSRNALGPEGIEAVARLLPRCSSLSSLDLSGNAMGINTPGTCWQPTRGPGLTEVRVSVSDIGSAASRFGRSKGDIRGHGSAPRFERGRSGMLLRFVCLKA